MIDTDILSMKHMLFQHCNKLYLDLLSQAVYLL